MSRHFDMMPCHSAATKVLGRFNDDFVFPFQAGSMSKAIEIAFKTQQFGALQLISEDLDDRTDPEMLNKCAEFFIEHGQFDRAVNLLIVGHRVRCCVLLLFSSFCFFQTSFVR